MRKEIEKNIKQYWKSLGPGLTTGAADDDPSGIATYSQTGAKYGFGFTWLALFTIPLMSVVQEMCARIGMVTGQGLAANIKKHYSKKVLYFCTALLLFANTFNIGADLGAMSQGTQLIFPHLNFALLVVLFAILSLVFQIFIPYKTYAKYLKYLTFVLLAYIFSALMVDMDWYEVLRHTFVPSMSFSKDSIILLSAILGTTISPYLFFWQTSQEVEEHILSGEVDELQKDENEINSDIKKMRIDVWSGMFFSNLVMFFIIIACASTLFKEGITNIGTAADAAKALEPFAGHFASLLFAIGIIGTGFLAIPVLAGANSYAVSECFNWKEGLYRKWNEAIAFYGVIVVAVGLGILLNFIGLDPIKALIYSAVLNGLVAPVILFLIVRLSSNEEIMGKFKSRPITKIVGWIAVSLMAIVGVATIISLWL
ncbi:MAG: Nramp family divalent metal transporter [Candidatus Nomurabacteria bacterium]|nr:Nramp family divalent metal transporter [Candidatus Nomurabacteria bacterium]